MYRWLVFLHILSGFAFLMGHGISAGVYFMLRKERDAERIKMLLTLSRNSLGLVTGSLLLILITGIVAGIVGQWWGQWWIKLSVALLFLLWGAMAGMGSRILNEMRMGLGLKSSYNQPPRAERLTDEELNGLLERLNPVLLAVIGSAGLALLLYLMYFKPF